MDHQKIFRMVDHTLLYPVTTWDEIRVLCDQAMAYNAASVCIPPCYVKKARDYMGDKMRITTVIGFPNGNMTPRVKAFEAEDALANGADEIDMVINIGMLKAGETDYVLDEIKLLRKTVGAHVLKVIIETCLLTDEEKITMCDLVTRSGADFIKTSTGFSKAGATFDDIALFKKHVGSDVQIKAAGGIASFEDAERFIELGATRLGTSRVIKLAMNEKTEAGTY